MWVRIIRLAAYGLALMAVTCSAHAEDIRHRSFSPDEIEKMKQTRAVIHTKFGDLTIKFFPDKAPNHTNNFIELAQKGFYNKTTFHRVIPGFMIQGGDPKSKDADRSVHGTGGPGYALKAEFTDLPHNRGRLSMARSRHPDSAGCQFFICVADASFLDKKYSVFGEVISGMDVADTIVSQPRDERDNPKDRIEMTIDIIEPAPDTPSKKPEDKPDKGNKK